MTCNFRHPMSLRLDVFNGPEFVANDNGNCACVGNTEN